MERNKKLLYSNARKSVVEYVKSKNYASSKELNKFLFERYKFNSNQVAGLLHKMSTTEKSLKKVKRGVYTVYDSKSEVSTFKSIINDLDKIEAQLKEILAKSISDLDVEDLLEFKDIISKTENFKKVLKMKLM